MIAHHVGRGEQRALRRGRVGAHHDEQVGALDVGHREAPPSAVHEVRADSSSATGRRCRASRSSGCPTCRAARRCSGRARTSARAGCRCSTVTAPMPCSSITGASSSVQRGNASSQLDLLPLAVDLDHRPPDPIRIVVQGAERRALGADVPRLQVSSRLPRMLATLPSETSISKPHMASHSGQVYRCLPSSPVAATGLSHPRSWPLLSCRDMTFTGRISRKHGMLTDLVAHGVLGGLTRT